MVYVIVKPKKYQVNTTMKYKISRCFLDIKVFNIIHSNYLAWNAGVRVGLLSLQYPVKHLRMSEVFQLAAICLCINMKIDKF